MRVLMVLALVAAAYASVIPSSKDVGVMGVIEKTLIPLGDKIRQAEESSGRIFGGQPALLGEFPYQAGLLISYYDNTGIGVCGGSLVKPNRVVSAAHCWNDGTHQGWIITVVLGSITLFRGGTRVETRAVAQHPEWNPPNSISNDINVIYLLSQIPTSDTIAPIGLPPNDENFVGLGIASGFGVTEDGPITVNQFLSHVRLLVAPNSVCSSFSDIELQESHLCAFRLSGISTCRGDSGGPLAIDRSDGPVLIGVKSFGGCDADGFTAFTRVTSFSDFINEHIS